MYARLRSDLREAEEYPPLWGLDRYPLEKIAYKLIFDPNEKYECFQPDCWDDEELNLLMVDTYGHMFFGNSIDFEFEE